MFFRLPGYWVAAQARKWKFENGGMKIITDLKEFGFTNIKVKSLFDLRSVIGIISLVFSTIINLIRFSNLLGAI